MRFRAVIFDLDDTLYDEFNFVKGGYKAVAEYLAKRFGYDAGAIFSVMLSQYKLNGREKLFNFIVEKYNIHDSGIIKELLTVYRCHNPCISMYDDASTVINKLRSVKVKTGLITDGLKSVQEAKVRKLGLEKVIDNIIFTDELGDGNVKPSVIPFRIICEALGLPFADCCYIGDNPFKDFYGPNMINMISVRLNRGMYKDISPSDLRWGAKFTINSLEEIFSI